MERSMPADPQALFDKIQALPPERIAGVEDFVDFIASRAENKQLGRSQWQPAPPHLPRYGRTPKTTPTMPSNLHP